MTTAKRKPGRKPARSTKQQMTTEATYYYANNRAFKEGDELQAENDINQLLRGQ